MIVARDRNGIPSPIPVAAPPIYTDFYKASYDSLAVQLLREFLITFLPKFWKDFVVCLLMVCIRLLDSEVHFFSK